MLLFGSLGCLMLRTGVWYIFTPVLLNRLMSLPYINNKLLEVPIEDQRFNFLTQSKVLGDAITKILMKLAMLQATLPVGLLSYRL